MLGPERRFNEEYKKEVAANASSLEEKISTVNDQIRVSCSEWNKHIDKTEAEFYDQIKNKDEKDCTELIRTPVSFSYFTPEIIINPLMWCFNTDITGPNEITPQDINLVDRSLDLREKHIGINNDMEQRCLALKKSQEVLYEDLISLTMVETFFPQTSKKSKAAIYLLKNTLSNNSEYLESTVLENLTLKEATRFLKHIYDTQGSNIYFASNPSKYLKTKWVTDHLIEEVSSRFGFDNTCVIKKIKKDYRTIFTPNTCKTSHYKKDDLYKGFKLYLQTIVNDDSVRNPLR
ncbi:hypothetical protein HQ545_05160 [Candidatus Woesearchaeota archaeon]|nr:hypothetical protein [Candidatus Woesearchaeota archaeon]